MPHTVLVILAEGFEEIETIAPINILRRAGAEVTIASYNSQLFQNGRSNISIKADSLLSEIENPLQFNSLIIPGPAVFKLRESTKIIKLIKDFHLAKKIIGAICAAPLLLLDAGVITEKTPCTAHDSIIDEIPHINKIKSVVNFKNIITSRGAGTAVDFGLSMIEQIFGTEKELKSALLFTQIFNIIR